MSKIHGFGEQLAVGQHHEQRVLQWLERRGVVTPAGRHDQRRGIDAWLVTEDGQRRSVEVKSDTRASSTGNAFIEIETNGKGARSGWAYTSQADWLLYLVTGSAEALYVIRMSALRERLPGWLEAYPVRPARNDGYDTLGVTVPLCELENIAAMVDSP